MSNPMNDISGWVADDVSRAMEAEYGKEYAMGEAESADSDEEILDNMMEILYPA